MNNNASKLLEDILFRSNHSLEASVYVTRPLNHIGRFYVRSLDSDQDSDRYFYKSVSYSYAKSNNVIKAKLIGERFSLSSFRD